MQYGIPDYINNQHHAVYDERELYTFWKTQQGNSFISPLGESVYIVHPGIENSYAGPDFINAIVMINNQLLHGNIEIHAHAIDWFNHGHHEDPKYNNVILHVYSKGKDVEICSQSGHKITSIKIPHHFESSLCLQHINDFSQSEIVDIIRVWSYTRFVEISQPFNSTEDGLHRIFQFIDLRKRCNLSLSIEYLHQFSKYSQHTKLAEIENLVDSFPQFHHPKRDTLIARMYLLLELARLFIINPQKVASLSKGNLISILRDAHINVPTTAYLHEIMGNIIYPIKYLIHPKDEGHFEAWYLLPCNAYGKCKKWLSQTNLELPLTHGVQQGILALLKDCCTSMNSNQCPFTNKGL